MCGKSEMDRNVSYVNGLRIRLYIHTSWSYAYAMQIYTYISVHYYMHLYTHLIYLKAVFFVKFYFVLHLFIVSQRTKACRLKRSKTRQKSRRSRNTPELMRIMHTLYARILRFDRHLPYAKTYKRVFELVIYSTCLLRLYLLEPQINIA